MDLNFGSFFINEFSFENVLLNLQLNFSNIFFTVFALVVYSIIIWHYYRFLAKRDYFHIEKIDAENVIEHFINLLKEASFLAKYIFIFPIFSFIFFIILVSLLFLFVQGLGAEKVIFVAATIIATTRVLAYYSEDLAKDLAKLVPLSLVGLFIAQGDFFSISLLIEKLGVLVFLLTNIFSYIIFFIIIEISLRLLYSIKIIIFEKTGLKRREKLRFRKKLIEEEKKRLFFEQKKKEIIAEQIESIKRTRRF